MIDVPSDIKNLVSTDLTQRSIIISIFLSILFFIFWKNGTCHISYDEIWPIWPTISV